MGRKNAEPEPIQEPPAQEQEQKIGEGKIADLIREGIAELGIEAKTSEIVQYITTRHAHRQFNTNSLSSAISTAKTKARGDTGEPRQTRQPRLSTLAPVQSSQPTLDDLYAVQKVAESNGGVSALLKMVSAVHDVGEEVGGVAKLLACLEALQKFTGK